MGVEEEEPTSRLPAEVVEHAGAVGRVEERRRQTTGRREDGRRRTGLRGGGFRGGAGHGAAALRKIWGLIDVATYCAARQLSGSDEELGIDYLVLGIDVELYRCWELRQFW
jgi:hypothetical protein